jgi:hypothetical protein
VSCVAGVEDLSPVSDDLRTSFVPCVAGVEDLLSGLCLGRCPRLKILDLSEVWCFAAVDALLYMQHRVICVLS